LEKRLGLGVLAHRLVQPGQVIEALRREGIFWPKNLPPDPERLLKQRLGVGVSPIVNVPESSERKDRTTGTTSLEVVQK